MLRLMAVIAVFGGCTWAGIRACTRLKERAGLLAALRADIRRLTLLMGYSAEPLSRLSERIAEGRTAAFWHAFGEELTGSADVPTAWEKAMVAAAKADSPFLTLLTEPERSILLDYAAGLGGSGQHTQRENARLLEERLSAVAEEAMAEYARKGRMYRTMGLLTGAAAALLVL